MTERRTRHPEEPSTDEIILQRIGQLVWAAFFFALAIFAKFPGLDLLVSARYYHPDLGFIYRDNPIVLALYNWTRPIGWALILSLAVYALLAPWVARYFEKRQQPSLAKRARGAWRHMTTVAIVCALVGPGLVIEGYFKNDHGRPRPVQVVEFGGKDAYLGPLVQGAHPERNRSFVSSHAAAGFWLMSFGLTCGPIWRRRWLLIGMVTGGAVGLGRILQGGHFLSDVLFAFFFVWISCELVSWLDKRRLSRHT